jgi:LasA protease
MALVLIALLLSACQPQVASFSSGVAAEQAAPQQAEATPAGPAPTPLPTRPVYPPGELVDYTAQTGDTLPVLALRFNTSVDEIRQANTFIPQSATTMPPGMPMKIPIYYSPFWGTSFRIIPDSLFINGPAQVGFDTANFVSTQPGWLKDYKEYAADANRSAAEIIDLVALKFSVSPRLFLALLEHQSGRADSPRGKRGRQDLPSWLPLAGPQRALPPAPLVSEFAQQWLLWLAHGPTFIHRF